MDARLLANLSASLGQVAYTVWELANRSTALRLTSALNANMWNNRFEDTESSGCCDMGPQTPDPLSTAFLLATQHDIKYDSNCI